MTAPSPLYASHQRFISPPLAESPRPEPLRQHYVKASRATEVWLTRSFLVAGGTRCRRYPASSSGSLASAAASRSRAPARWTPCDRPRVARQRRPSLPAQLRLRRRRATSAGSSSGLRSSSGQKSPPRRIGHCYRIEVAEPKLGVAAVRRSPLLAVAPRPAPAGHGRARVAAGPVRPDGALGPAPAQPAGP